MKPFKTVIAPKGCPDWLTAGKEYEVKELQPLKHDKNRFSFFITDDDGETLNCISTRCAYLDGRDWIIKELPEAQTGDEETDPFQKLRNLFFDKLKEQYNGDLPKDEMYHLDWISDALDEFIWILPTVKSEIEKL